MEIDHELIRRVMLNEYRRNKASRPLLVGEEYEFKWEKQRAKKRLATKRRRDLKKADTKRLGWI